MTPLAVKVDPTLKRTAAICAVMLALFYLLGWLSMRVKSATIDEPLHAAAGYHHLFGRDFRINSEDPPLWKYWAMIPHRRGELHPDPDLPLWDQVLENMVYQYVTSIRLMYQIPGNDGGEFVNTSRMMMLIVGVALGATVAAWSWQLAGATGAIVACLLFVFDPNFLGHAPLVKNDVSLSLVMFGLAWATWSVGKRGRWWNVLLVGLLCAAAVTVKFSGLLLGPMAALMLAARALLPRGWVVFGKELTGRAARLAAATGICLFAAAVSYLAIWACYGFRFDPTPIPGAMLNMDREVRRFKQEVLYVARGMSWPSEEEIAAAPVPKVARIAMELQERRLLPQAWLYGLVFTYRSTLMRPTFLLGQHGELGWWYYFPLAMLFKTPMATIAAVLLSVVTLLRHRAAKPQAETPPYWSWICIAVPLVVYGASALTTNLNLGLRHVLPLYPFIYLLVGTAASRARALHPRGFIPVAAVLGLVLLVESFSTFPHYLSYFNAPSRPHRLRLLSDSNFDWGQDLTYVLEWQQRNPGTTLYLGYCGSVDPEFYGIRYTNIPGGFAMKTRRDWPPSRPGVVALSATLLQGVNCPTNCIETYAPFRIRKPRKILGDTIYLYDWPLK